MFRWNFVVEHVIIVSLESRNNEENEIVICILLLNRHGLLNSSFLTSILKRTGLSLVYRFK